MHQRLGLGSLLSVSPFPPLRLNLFPLEISAVGGNVYTMMPSSGCFPLRRELRLHSLSSVRPISHVLLTRRYLFTAIYMTRPIARHTNSPTRLFSLFWPATHSVNNRFSPAFTAKTMHSTERSSRKNRIMETSLSFRRNSSRV